MLERIKQEVALFKKAFMVGYYQGRFSNEPDKQAERINSYLKRASK